MYILAVVVVQEQAQGQSLDPIRGAGKIVANKELEHCVGPAVAIQRHRQRRQHVGVPVHVPWRVPVLRIGNDRIAVAAAPAAHDEHLILVLQRRSIAHFLVRLALNFILLLRVYRVRATREVESLDAVRPLPIPVRAGAAKDFDRRVAVAVSGMVIVDDRVQFDVGAGGDPAEGVHVRLERAVTERENIDELFLCPGLDIDPVEVTALDIVTDAHRQQIRSATPVGDFLEHCPDLAHETSQDFMVLPLMAGRKIYRGPLKIELDAVEVVLLRRLTQHLQLVFAHPFELEIQQGDLVQGGVVLPRLDRPFRMLRLDRHFCLRAQVAVAGVEAIGEKRFEAAPVRGFQVELRHVDALRDPAAVLVAVVEGQQLARIRRGLALSPAPPEAVDMAARFVG